MELELPNLEDIYDFNETLLRSWLEKVDNALSDTARPKEEKWERKATRVKELIEIEIDERISINQISMFCFKELSSDFYKEVIQESEPADSTRASSDALETQEDQETGLKLWNNRKKVKGKDYFNKIRETLKNTEISNGLVVGTSSAKPTMKGFNERSRKANRSTEEEKKVIKETSVKKVLTKTGNFDRKVQGKARSLSKGLSDTKQQTSTRHDEAKNLNTGREKVAKPAKAKTEANTSARLGNGESRTKKLSESQSESSKSTPGKLNQRQRKTTTPQISKPEVSQSCRDTPSKLYQEEAQEGQMEITDYILMQEDIQHEYESSKTDLEKSELNSQELDVEKQDKIENTSQEKTSDEVAQTYNKEESTAITDLSKERNQDISSTKTDTYSQEKIQQVYEAGYDSEIGNTGEESNSDTETQAIDTDSYTTQYSASSIIYTDTYKEENSITISSRKVESLYPESSLKQDLDSDLTSSITSRGSSNQSSSETHPLRQAKQKLIEYTSQPDSSNTSSRVREIIQEKQNQAKISATSYPDPSSRPTDSPKLTLDLPNPTKDPSKSAPEQSSNKKPATKKPPLPKQALPKPKPQPEPDPNAVDYTQYYKFFSDVFSGSDSKEFNYLNTLREAISVFKEFNSIIDSPEFELQKKFKLSVAPLEINPRDLIHQDISSILAPRTLCENEMYYRVVRARAEVYDIVTRSFTKKKAWTELPHGMNLRHSWNVMWTWSKPTVDFTKLLVWQKVNHFPNTKNFSRKDLLKRNIEKMMKISNKCAAVWNIIPCTYILPKEYIQFVEEYTVMSEKCPEENVWIMKPVGKSRGRGISMINDLSQVTYGEPMVIQKYLYRPLLLGGFKFDLRIYVLITAFNPLEVFLYKEGFARLSTVPYSTKPDKLLNKYIHLTNSSIQKHNSNPATDSVDYIFGGTKISLQTLRERLQNDSISYDKIWHQIREIIIKSLIAVQSEIPAMSCCFDLVGFDIIIDQNLQAWLIEINSSPSLARENVLDDMIKQQLVDDTLDLVDPVFFNRQELVKVLERRLNEVQKGQYINSSQQLTSDLMRILEGRRPRQYGEEPRKMGNYEMIAPSPIYEKYYKLAYPRG
jgi:tubulin polyglutamylase TTLL5